MAAKETNPDEPTGGVPSCESPQSVRGSYSDSLKLSVLIQLPLFVFAALLLDGGQMLRGVEIAAAGYWVGAVLIMVRRPKHPTQVDLDLVKYGFVLTCGCVTIIAVAVTVTRATLET